MVQLAEQWFSELPEGIGASEEQCEYIGGMSFGAAHKSMVYVMTHQFPTQWCMEISVVYIHEVHLWQCLLPKL